MTMTTPIRETSILVDVYTREARWTPEDGVTLYQGDSAANRLIFSLTNQGVPVDASGYSLFMRCVRPDSTVVTVPANVDDGGRLWAVLPAAVYTQTGAITCSCTLISVSQIVTAFELRLRVLPKRGVDAYVGVDAGNALPSYDLVLTLIRELEEALGLIAGGDTSQETLSTRLMVLENFMRRSDGFANAAQGQTAQNNAAQLAQKLDAAQFTAANLLEKLRTVDGTGSGLDADTLGGLTAETLIALCSPRATSIRQVALVTLTIPVEGWAYQDAQDRYALTLTVPEARSNFTPVLTIDPAAAGPKVPVFGIHSNNGEVTLLAAGIPAVASTATLQFQEVG